MIILREAARGLQEFPFPATWSLVTVRNQDQVEFHTESIDRDRDQRLLTSKKMRKQIRNQTQDQ